jgi:hypothetical protein
VLDDLGDGAEPDVVGAGEGDEIGEPCHLAVVAHDLDDASGGVEPGEAAEVERALGLPDADEDAPIA